ncbi:MULTISPECIES: hypothetical protein [unclassified Aureispira]|uniref:hypothetical protein n=1 Tax=unclassified Aureispira TaxID=2649989 RepID=UPI000697287A|nr:MULTISPECIES: hypothetical protein [unclassified Aureispira]WMX14301.1 hypothetical protein QP953_25945 [Aureispira sp. CCB-E]
MAKRKVAPKNRLEEITVQKRAQSYLEQYYKIKHGKRHLFSNIEERTKKQYGMKRADGLLAYKLNKRRAYVVSMEAKSHKTLPALRPYRVNKVWIKDSIWKSFLFTLASGVLFFAWRQDGWLVLMPFGVWFLAMLVHLLLFKNSYKYQEMEVIHQVFQYPANEQWLSLSEDSFDMIKEHLRMNLIKICKARDIGVLMVDQDLNVNMIHPPKARKRFWFYGYLTYYHNEEAIRKHLGINPRLKKKTKKKKTKKTRKRKK